MLGQYNSPGAKCHNAWVSDDGDYLYTTDEISNGFIGEFDISDLTNIQITDEIQTELDKILYHITPIFLTITLSLLITQVSSGS